MIPVLSDECSGRRPGLESFIEAQGVTISVPCTVGRAGQLREPGWASCRAPATAGTGKLEHTNPGHSWSTQTPATAGAGKTGAHKPSPGWHCSEGGAFPLFYQLL